VSGETPSGRAMSTDLIKLVTAGDWVTGREVYKKPTKFKPFAKHYLGMNTLPDIEDNTHGMWRRIYVIQFPRKFAEHEMDVELTNKLMGELSGIFNWALDGYKRLKNRKFIFSESISMKRSKKRYKQESNSALDFAERCLCKSNINESVSLMDAFKHYKSFCEIEGFKKMMSKTDLRRVIESEGYLVKNSSKHANQVRIFGTKTEFVS